MTVDVELNAAVLHLGTKYLPRGFDVVGTTLTDADYAEQDKRKEAGFDQLRPLVKATTEADPNLFGDLEVENTHRALMTRAFSDPVVREGHDHEGICDGIILAAIKRINALVVETYGDDERTARWRKLLSVYTIGGMIHRAAPDGSVVPDLVTETVETVDAMSDITPDQLADDMMQVYQKYAVITSALAQYVKENPGSDISFTPSDPRQNAPTTATRQ